MNSQKKSIYERQLRLFFLCKALCNRAKKTREFGRRNKQNHRSRAALIVSYINKFRTKENLPENIPELLKIPRFL